MQEHRSACILCSINCGVRLGVEGDRILKVRGDRDHKGSRGYLCEKAQRLDYYQNGRQRLTTPLERQQAFVSKCLLTLGSLVIMVLLLF